MYHQRSNSMAFICLLFKIKRGLSLSLFQSPECKLRMGFRSCSSREHFAKLRQTQSLQICLDSTRLPLIGPRPRDMRSVPMAVAKLWSYSPSRVPRAMMVCLILRVKNYSTETRRERLSGLRLTSWSDDCSIVVLKMPSRWSAITKPIGQARRINKLQPKMSSRNCKNKIKPDSRLSQPCLFTLDTF